MICEEESRAERSALVVRPTKRYRSKMTASILKALNGPLDAFNDVRNNQSLAHDSSLLNYEEAMLVFNHVTSALPAEFSTRVRPRTDAIRAG